MDKPLPNLLEIQGLTLEFDGNPSPVRALDDVNLSVKPGETVCLVGESGSGKTLTALSVARLLSTPPARYLSGSIHLDGREILGMNLRELRKIRGGLVSYIFQDPASALNPVLRVEDHLLETLSLHRPDAATSGEAMRLLQLVGIPDPQARLRSYPHELSGGMQQRVLIAIAIASNPRLLIADEPTTALDVTIQAQIIDLLAEFKSRLGMGLLLITHNLGIVSEIADRVAVMYAGQIVETGPARHVLTNPLHPYTRALIQSIPSPGSNLRRLRTIPGQVPQPGKWPGGCRFAPRCELAVADCARTQPQLQLVEPTHQVRCPLWKNSPDEHQRA